MRHGAKRRPTKSYAAVHQPTEARRPSGLATFVARAAAPFDIRNRRAVGGRHRKAAQFVAALEAGVAPGPPAGSQPASGR